MVAEGDLPPVFTLGIEERGGRPRELELDAIF